MTVGLYQLRAKELGFTMAELSEMSAGMLVDIYIERRNDRESYAAVATQEDFDTF